VGDSPGSTKLSTWNLWYLHIVRRPSNVDPRAAVRRSYTTNRGTSRFFRFQYAILLLRIVTARAAYRGCINLGLFLVRSRSRLYRVRRKSKPQFFVYCLRQIL